MKINHLKSALAVAALCAVSAPAAQTINGAGATFPDPIYQKWFPGV